MGRGRPRPASPEGSDPLRLVRRLRCRSWRDRTGLYYAEGARNLLQAVEHGIPIETLIVSWKLLQTVPARKLVRRLRRSGTPCRLVSPETFRELSQQTRAAGIGVVLRQPWTRLSKVDPHAGTVWILLREVRAPGNLGTLLRSLAAVGGGGAILLGEGPDPFDPAVVRATMGSLHGLKLVRASPEAFARWKERADCTVIGTSPAASRTYDEVEWRRGSIVFLGGERSGLLDDDLALCDAVVRIPMTDEVDSLNLGVAGSLMVYEAYRAARWGLGTSPAPA